MRLPWGAACDPCSATGQKAKPMSRRALLTLTLTVALVGVVIPGAALSQDPPPPLSPAAPGSAGPTWQRTLRLSDGRTFVTDGGLAIDAALAKPATLPAGVLPNSSVLERQLSAQ